MKVHLYWLSPIKHLQKWGTLSIILLCFFAPKQIAIKYIDGYTQNLLNTESSTPPITADPMPNDIWVLSTWVAKQYAANIQKSSREHCLVKIFESIRPYLQHLPSPIRIPIGLTEVTSQHILGYGTGCCDSATRLLSALLLSRGYSVRTTHLFSQQFGGHTVLTVLLDNNRAVLIDPYAKVILWQQIPLDFKSFQKNMQQDDTDITHWIRPLYNEHTLVFYEKPHAIFASVQGEAFTISMQLPNIHSKQRLLSTSDDYYPSHLDYIGCKYDRTWTRQVVSQQSIELTLKLEGHVKKELLHTNIPPTVQKQENALIWHLSPNQVLEFYDYLSPVKWRAKDNFQQVTAITIRKIDLSD